MFLEFIRAFGFIFVAEMGDKTQILAMAFATKYKLKKHESTYKRNTSDNDTSKVITIFKRRKPKVSK